MTVTIVPANPGFFVIYARPGEMAYEIFSRELDNRMAH